MSRNKAKVFIYLVGMEEEGINAIYLAAARFLNPSEVCIILPAKSKELLG